MEPYRGAREWFLVIGTVIHAPRIMRELGNSWWPEGTRGSTETHPLTLQKRIRYWPYSFWDDPGQRHPDHVRATLSISYIHDSIDTGRGVCVCIRFPRRGGI